jgi:hypothetical protein
LFFVYCNFVFIIVIPNTFRSLSSPVVRINIKAKFIRKKKKVSFEFYFNELNSTKLRLETLAGEGITQGSFYRTSIIFNLLKIFFLITSKWLN